MPDITAIATFLGAIKTTTEIAKAIKLSDSSIEKAELKLKIAELMESLAEVKMQAVEIQELIQEKDKRIKELENNLENKSKLIFTKGHYYEADEDGKPTGEPYCSNCWESSKKMIHLVRLSSLQSCPTCKAVSKRRPF